MNPDVSRRLLVEQMKNQMAEIRRLEEANTKLRELVDGCEPLVESAPFESPAFEAWKRDWLRKAKRWL